MNIHFIGFGNMAKAIAKSLCKHPENYQIFASAPSLKAGKTAEGIITNSDNLAGLAKADIIILAVKPFMVAEVLTQIKPNLPQNALLISVVAGLNLNLLEQYCSTSQAIIRSMPNIPIEVGKGATPMIANHSTNEEQKQLAANLFQCSGIISWAHNEDEIDSFTALSGSGPAYAFFFLEAMIDAAKKLGLNADIAKDFALQTVAGAVEIAKHSEESLCELRTKVTSPAGTTAAAIAILEDQGFKELLFNAMNAAYARAKQLTSGAS